MYLSIDHALEAIGPPFDASERNRGAVTLGTLAILHLRGMEFTGRSIESAEELTADVFLDCGRIATLTELAREEEMTEESHRDAMLRGTSNLMKVAGLRDKDTISILHRDDLPKPRLKLADTENGPMYMWTEEIHQYITSHIVPGRGCPALTERADYSDGATLTHAAWSKFAKWWTSIGQMKYEE